MREGENKRLKGKKAYLRLRIFSLVFSFLILPFYFCLPASAQDDQTDTAPPPLKLISKNELIRLDAETDLKARTKLSLELMNERLMSAEKLSSAEDFAGVYRELGVFQGLMDNSLDFLDRRNAGGGKVLDNFKRLDIALRAFVPRIETIYRNMPHRFEEYVRKLMKYVRDARTKATDPMFSDSVLPQRKPNNDDYL